MSRRSLTADHLTRLRVNWYFRTPQSIEGTEEEDPEKEIWGRGLKIGCPAVADFAPLMFSSNHAIALYNYSSPSNHTNFPPAL